MSKSGTTRGAVLRRRGRGKKTRLDVLVRRFGQAGIAVLFLGAFGVWMLWSGLPGRLGGLTQNAFYAHTARAGFVVRNVLVEGRVNADPAVLRELVGMKPGDPIFAFHPHDVKVLLEQVPWVKAANVERRLPDTIFVRLAERTPFALWQNKGKLHLIDREGVTLTSSGLERFSHLLLVVGEDAPFQASRLLALLDAEPALRRQVEAATLVGGRRWDLRLKSGMQVRLPENDPGFALTRLMRAQESDGLLNKDLTSIDLRDNDRIIVAVKPGAVQEYKAGSGDI